MRDRSLRSRKKYRGLDRGELVRSWMCLFPVPTEWTVVRHGVTGVGCSRTRSWGKVSVGSQRVSSRKRPRLRTRTMFRTSGVTERESSRPYHGAPCHFLSTPSLRSGTRDPPRRCLFDTLEPIQWSGETRYHRNRHFTPQNLEKDGDALDRVSSPSRTVVGRLSVSTSSCLGRPLGPGVRGPTRKTVGVRNRRGRTGETETLDSRGTTRVTG